MSRHIRTHTQDNNLERKLPCKMPLKFVRAEVHFVQVHFGNKRSTTAEPAMFTKPEKTRTSFGGLSIRCLCVLRVFMMRREILVVTKGLI